MNNVTLIGRLTKDPELSTGASVTVGRFTLAINRPYSKDGNQEADFIRCVVFGKTAEACVRYLAKGKMAGVQGRIQTGSYEKDGKRIYTTDVIVDRVEFLTPKTSNDNKGDNFVPPDGFHEYELEEDEGIPF